MYYTYNVNITLKHLSLHISLFSYTTLGVLSKDPPPCCSHRSLIVGENVLLSSRLKVIQLRFWYTTGTVYNKRDTINLRRFDSSLGVLF